MSDGRGLVAECPRDLLHYFKVRGMKSRGCQIFLKGYFNIHLLRIIERVDSMRTIRWLMSLVCVGFLVLGTLGFSVHPSEEFDFSKYNVPLEDILSGGPPKDGIPAILNPVFVTASKADFLNEEDRILGLVEEGETKAYPIKILNWHEIVNDRLDGKPVVVTFCPLCGTGIGFEGKGHGRAYTFGVSGLLYQSDLLMYDHQTESLWSQISMEAVAGPLTGTKLQHVFLEHTTWGEWKRVHPSTLVLSTKTGYHRNYDRDPYLGYAQRPELMFPINHSDDRYHPKEWGRGNRDRWGVESVSLRRIQQNIRASA